MEAPHLLHIAYPGKRSRADVKTFRSYLITRNKDQFSLGRRSPLFFPVPSAMDERFEKAKTFPKEDWDDAHVDFVNQPGS